MKSGKKSEIKTVEFFTERGTIQKQFIPFDKNDRTAVCTMCNITSKSDEDLPHFKKTGAFSDIYYCGCHGWD